jgi:hypothetical protein
MGMVLQLVAAAAATRAVGARAVSAGAARGGPERSPLDSRGKDAHGSVDSAAATFRAGHILIRSKHELLELVLAFTAYILVDRHLLFYLQELLMIKEAMSNHSW